MKKYILLLSLCVNTVFAQETNIEPLPTQEDDIIESEIQETPQFEEEKIIPIIKTNTHIETGVEMFADATDTKLISPSHGQANYSWDFGDETAIAWGENVSHVYESPGIYQIKLKVSQGRISEFITQEVIVYNRKGVLFIDNDMESEQILYQAGTQGLYLKPIIHQTETGFSAEEDFIRKIQENIEFLKESESILFYTKSTDAIQAFNQFWQKISEENKFDPTEKFWAQLLEEGSLNNSTTLLQPVFSTIKPQFILLTRPSAFNIIFKNRENAQIIKLIEQRKIEHIIVDQRSATTKALILSNLMSYFVTNGISQNVIYLLLAVPFITFTIAFFRQFVGISTFGVYTPLMLCLSFLVLGFEFGFIVFTAVMFVSYLIRTIFEKIDLLYIPKVSLLFSFLAVSFFLILGVAIYFDMPINLTLTIFPMLMMVSISEKFISTQSSSGIKRALLSTTETIFIALIAYFLVTWEWLENLILSIPEIILIPIFLTTWLGKFTGLRMSEYFKFRTLFREDSQEE